MAIITLQSEIERKRGICYQFDSAKPPIGEGGMGRVFQGVCIEERTKATRPVAIKFMFDDLPPNAYERARREAEIQLRNDNLVEMLGFIETEERSATGEVRKHYHVVSELLTGVSLSDILEGKTKDRNGEEVPFAVKMLQDYRNDSEHFATIIVMNVLSGLMALHDAGYIHRDIDPTNIMLTSDGHIKLIDFGIAKQMRLLTTGDKALTVAGKFMGKPEYAAPELVLGDISHQNQTTDIYAMGVLLYQCIVGHTPFEGPRHEVLEKQLRTKMDLKVVKNKALRNVIATACQKKQELRYQTSAQMRVALESAGGSKTLPSKQKTRIILGIVFGIVATLLLTFFIVRHKHNRLRQEAEEKIVLERAEQLRQATQEKIDNTLDKATKLYRQGINKEDEDGYELTLMSAYSLFAQAHELIVQSNLPITDPSLGMMQQTLTALDSAQIDFKAQAEVLKELGETELVDFFQHRIDSIETFIQNNEITPNY